MECEKEMGDLYDQLLDAYKRVVKFAFVFLQYNEDAQRDLNDCIKSTFERLGAAGQSNAEMVITVQNTVIQALTDIVLQFQRDYAQGKREHNFTYDGWTV